ncbi:MAG: LPO_1073/Vpar_1526 family protein [Pseudomonadota bacterium]
MDPITTLAISSAIGGAAGSFVKEISTNGVKWLIELVTTQSTEMQEIAKRNMENFVIRLAQRVERLEKDIDPSQAFVFEDALKHPSSALLIKGAMIDAAATENQDKHEILSELIAQRLTAGADDMIALAGAAACNVVTSLSSRQIKALAVLVTTHAVRPLVPPTINDGAQAAVVVEKWWSDNLGPLLANSDFAASNNLDFEHLAAMGCIRISIGLQNFSEVLVSGIVQPNPAANVDSFKGKAWFDSINSKWELLGHATPTSIGQLIGILHRDAKLGSSTKINW